MKSLFSIRFKLIVSFIGLTIAGVALLWNFNIFFVLRDWSKYTVGLSLFAGICAALALGAAIALWIQSGPLSRAEKAMKADPESHGVKKAFVTSRVRALTRTFLVANSIGFFIGPVIQHMVVSLTAGVPFFTLELVVSVLYSTAIGSYATLMEIRLAERFSLALIQRTGQTTMEGSRRKSIITRQFQLGAILVFLSFSLFFSAGYGFVKDQLVPGAAVDAESSASETVDANPVGEFAWKMCGLGVFVLALALAALWLESRPLADRLEALMRGIDRLAQGAGGDDEALIVSQGDEIGVLTDGFNRIMLRQTSLLKEVKSLAKEVGEDAKALMILGDRSRSVSDGIAGAQDRVSKAIGRQQAELGGAAESLSALWKVNREQEGKIREQSESIESGGESITHMTSSIDSVSSSASVALERTRTLMEGASENMEAMEELVREIENVTEASGEVTVRVSSIAKIAAQTNLLAMNAAIEAAHAGEAGAGFAVVASEVRNLSEQASRAVKEINDHIKKMGDRSRSGLEKTKTARARMSELNDEVASSAELFTRITEDMERQGTETSSVRNSIELLLRTTREIRELTDSQQAEGEKAQKRMTTLGSAATEIEAGMKEHYEALGELRAFTENLENLIERYAGITLRLTALFKEKA